MRSLLQPLSTQLETFTSLNQSRTAALARGLAACESRYQTCRACDAAHSGLELELEELVVEAGWLQDAMQRRIHFVENQASLRSSGRPFLTTAATAVGRDSKFRKLS